MRRSVRSAALVVLSRFNHENPLFVNRPPTDKSRTYDLALCRLGVAWIRHVTLQQALLPCPRIIAYSFLRSLGFREAQRETAEGARLAERVVRTMRTQEILQGHARRRRRSRGRARLSCIMIDEFCPIHWETWTNNAGWRIHTIMGMLIPLSLSRSFTVFGMLCIAAGQGARASFPHSQV